ncbi:Eco57I restriction endonuclease [Peptostreptococcus anaerobius]|uniref:Eco57I restriction endonuclease n=2 Tax=Peptostreptococcus anaerobius TaxID=1261 RepID=A0A135YYS0_9FIRM|nr:Eco57I restriction endonuclease [Peptostreptococcus anaerobius]
MNMSKKLFDFAIGNPPYQEESQGENKALSMPVYHKFMDAAKEVSDVVELIHPARFLFKTGRTPNEFNDRKLNDEHFKILHYEPNPANIFPNTEIKGGVVISLQDENKNFGKIETFIPSDTLRKAFEHVWRNPNHNTKSIYDMISPRLMFRYSEILFDDYLDLDRTSGPLHAVQSDAFDKNSRMFKENDIFNGGYKFWGKIKGVKDRVWRYIDPKYIEDNPYLNKWKVFMPRSNGSGAFGEVLAKPAVGGPGTGGTDTFICIGPMETEDEANAILQYIKTKFVRAMLSILKTTQGNTRPAWKYVPLQDFTSKSDIDWSKSIHEIDLQLYRKYGLSAEEVAFIETNVKEME